MGYDLGGGTELFADLQFSYSKLKLDRLRVIPF
jgi:iron complex outermembrane receptor protein